jgi:hypothetical protein
VSGDHILQVSDEVSGRSGRLQSFSAIADCRTHFRYEGQKLLQIDLVDIGPIRA